jgi:hypothetical protein
MFDPKKTALLILGKARGGSDPGDEGEGLDGKEAFKAAMEAAKDGDYDAAYDAFKAAVAACGDEPDGDEGY